MIKTAINTIVLILLLTQSLWAKEITPGKYYIQSKIQGKYMDVKGAKSDNGTPLHLWPKNNSIAQKFSLENAGNGYFYIKSDLGKYIHVKDRSNKSGVIAHIWSGKGNDNTKWKFEDAGNGYYFIKSKKGTYLDVKGGSGNNGTPIWLYTKNGSNAQKWKLIQRSKTAQENYGCALVPQKKSFKLTEKCISSLYGHLLNKHREFGGPVIVHGEIILSTKDFKNINCEMRISMKGKKKNTPKIHARWDDIVYTAPEGFVLSNVYKTIKIPRTVLPESSWEAPLGCNDGEKHKIDLVGSDGTIELIADTGAKDISSDSDCNCDSKVIGVHIPNFKFNIKCEDLIIEKSGKYMLRNKQKNAYLTDDLKFKKNIKIVENTGEYGVDVQFYIERKEITSNLIYIKSQKNGKYLAIVNGKLVYTDKKSANTIWITQRMENGYFRIVHQETGYVLHVGSNGAIISKNKNGESSLWRLEPPYQVLL